MKLAVVPLLVISSFVPAPCAAKLENVQREIVSHFCDFSDPDIVSGESCEARRHRHLDVGVPHVEELAQSLAGFSSTLEIPMNDFDATSVGDDESDHWATIINFGGELLEKAMNEYHGLVEVTVDHDEGSTTKVRR